MYKPGCSARVHAACSLSRSARVSPLALGSRGRCARPPIALALVALIASALLGVGQPRAQDLSAPFVLPGDSALSPAAGKQLSPEISAGNGMFLCVWVDDRTTLNQINTWSGGPNFAENNGSMWDIYAARLDASGALLDSIPIVMAQQTLNQSMPDVAWNGENWLVVWSGQEGLACCPNNHIYAARVSPAGLLLDTTPIVVDMDSSSNGLLWPAVASDGVNWVVAWRDLSAQGTVFTLDGARVAPDGTVLDPGGVVLRQDSFNSYPVDPDLAFAGDEFLLTWEEGSGRVMGQRLSRALQRLGSPFRINLYSPSTGLNPRVATDGTDYFVAWWENRYQGWSELVGARVNAAGQVLDPAGIRLTEAYGYTNYEPSITWDGSVYYVVFDKDAFAPDMYAARVTAAGAVLDFGGFLVASAPGLQNESSVAPRPGGGAVAVWQDQRFGGDFPFDIFASVLTGANAGPDYCISLGAPRQTSLDMVADATGYLAIFRSETSAGVRILAHKLDSSGRALSPEPIEVAAGPYNMRNPAVAWNGSVYFVTWNTGTTVYGRRLDANGTPIDPQPLFLLPGEQPDVAALGEVFLIASSHESPPHTRLIKGVRLRGSDGAILDGTPLIVGQSFSWRPALTALGSRWFAVWEQWPSHDNDRSNIYGSFVSAAGVPTSYFPVIYTAVEVERSPAVAAQSDTALVVWKDSRPGYYFEDIYGRRILSDGTLLGPSTGSAIAAAPRSQYDPAIASDGSQYIVIQGDTRNESQNGQRKGDIYAERVKGDGGVIDPLGFPVAADTLPEVHPNVAARPNGALYGYSDFRETYPFGAYRITLRVSGAGAASITEITPPLSDWTVFPNPSSSTTHLRFGNAHSRSDAPSSAGALEARIFDAAGREVARLASAEGAQQLTWDGKDRAGRGVAPGIYFARVRAEGAERVVRVIRD